MPHENGQMGNFNVALPRIREISVIRDSDKSPMPHENGKMGHLEISTLEFEILFLEFHINSPRKWKNGAFH